MAGPTGVGLVVEHLERTFPGASGRSGSGRGTGRSGPAGWTARRTDGSRTPGGPVRAVADLGLTLSPGESLALVGPSGCGKTTVLNILAGLDHADAGSVRWQGQRVDSLLGLAAYMPQHDALLPWLDVCDNVSLALRLRGVERGSARRSGSRTLEAFGLGEFSDMLPGALSGGMRARAAFARTVLAGGEVLLLDEPFGALDALTRRRMQDWLSATGAVGGAACLLVTHDIEEAVQLCDRVLVLTPRPARGAALVDVDLPRPRGPHTRADPRFQQVCTRVAEELDRADHEARTAPAGAAAPATTPTTLTKLTLLSTLGARSGPNMPEGRNAR
jgi:ABC-type nitrate/sulfonate/bicarbonate transport system, ATPase component